MKTKINNILSGTKQALFALAFTVFFGTAYSQTTYTFSYTGSVQTQILQGGSYSVQCWGGNGGDNMAAGTGGKGGFSTGTINVVSSAPHYFYVAGKGITGIGGQASAPGGYNGGGDAGAYTSSTYGMGSGGGATHIASALGLLNTLSSNQSAVVIVAGGGGGAGSNNGPTTLLNLGGNGGGVNGGNGLSGNPSYGGTGGTQTTGGFGNIQNGNFGQGGNNSGSNTGGGGGGGWYGGGAAQWEGSGGGSGYIGGVINGTTAATGQPGFIPNPDVTGNGYIILTHLCAVSATVAKNPICFGESTNLTTNAASNIVWGHTSSTSNMVNVAPTVNTNYTVTGQAASGCTTSIVLSVTVHPLPSLSALVTPSVLCVGKSATLTGQGANSYTWSATNTPGNTTTVNPVVTSSFNYSGTNQYNCVNSNNVNVIVNSNSLGITPNTSVCKGNAINLSASGAQSYTWSTGSLFGTTPVSPLVNTSYTASGTDIHNCILSNVVSVTVNNAPSVLATTNKTLVCQGEGVTITGSGATTYTWSSGFVGASLITTLPVNIHYYYSVTGTDANGCSSIANIVITAVKCVGINESENSALSFNVVPNPGAGLFSVRTDKVSAQLKMAVYNELGQLVKTQDLISGEGKLDLQNEKAGMYFVRISENENVLKVIKLIKE
ncbi:MAG: T9SS type A sorting domain-containing protein [Bacteroidota bacterium]